MDSFAIPLCRYDLSLEDEEYEEGEEELEGEYEEEDEEEDDPGQYNVEYVEVRLTTLTPPPPPLISSHPGF